MDSVAANWLGPAIGGAVGATAWAASQLQNLGQSVVDAAVDVFEAIQPDPYEEWLNAPTASEATSPAEFRNPKTETNRTPTAEEIITNAAKEEVQTGVASPIGPEDPYSYQQAPVLEDNTDPQAPITPEFQDVPEPKPATPAADNVVMTYTNPNITSSSVIEPPGIWPTFRGVEAGKTTTPFNEMVFSAVLQEDENGQVAWIGRAQALMNGTVKRTWNFNAGTNPPSAGDFGLYLRVDKLETTFDLLSPSNHAGGIKVERFSLSQPDIPPQVPEKEMSFPLPVLPKPQAPADTQSVPVNDPGFDYPTWSINNPSVPDLPTLPDTVVPTAPNNPSVVPEIGTDGLPVLTPANVPVTSTDTHVVGNTPIPSGGVSPTLAGIASEVGRIESKTADTLRQVQNNQSIWDKLPELLLLLDALAGLFEQPMPSKSYSLTGVCEDTSDDGNQPSTTVILPQETWADRVISLGDMMPELLQASKNYKQPICEQEPPTSDGDFRTISFRSDQTSPYGKSRLRKRFRYRSITGNDLGAVVDHWKDFVFEGGPYRVRWIGGTWGAPEVWAASEAEGKRVIQHAAAEAGFDPFENGRWSTRVSSSTRRGVPGTMRVDTTKGFYWITARDGSSERPIVAKT